MAIARGWKSLTQREFADRLTGAGFHIDASAVSRIEKGTRAVRLNEAVIIADVLDIDLNMLIGDLDRSPGAELRRMRRDGNAAYRGLREPLVRFAQAYIWVYEHLKEFPELLREVDLAGGVPKSPEDYFALAAEAIAQIEVDAQRTGEREPEEDYVLYEHEGSVEGIRLVLDAYLKTVLLPLRELDTALETFGERADIKRLEAAFEGQEQDDDGEHQAEA